VAPRGALDLIGLVKFFLLLLPSRLFDEVNDTLEGLPLWHWAITGLSTYLPRTTTHSAHRISKHRASLCSIETALILGRPSLGSLSQLFGGESNNKISVHKYIQLHVESKFAIENVFLKVMVV